MIINANIIEGENSFSRLQDLLSDYGYQNPAVIVDKNLYESSDYVSGVLNNIVEENKIIFFDHHFEPSYQMLDRLMGNWNENQSFEKVDVLIGIGGGSAMDTTKGLAILCKNIGPAINYKGFPTQLNQPLPVIAIPSTTGTGSEVVFNASFIDEDSKVKMGINYKNNYPVLSILDPLIPSTAPRNVLESSGCDALVHSLESFMSKRSNNHVRYFSKRAYNLILSNMVPLLEGEGDLSNWLNMQWAAIYAMFALSNSTSGPTGALSYYLGTNFKVNHGVAGGVFIGKVARYNHDNGYFDLGDLYEKNIDKTLGKEKKSTLVLQQIEELLALANIPERISSFGVNNEDLKGFNRFANQAKEAFDFNPVKINPNQVADLFIML